MRITFGPIRKGWDNVDAFADGIRFGFRGLNSGHICVERCPKCHTENYCMNVTSGMCGNCGWNPSLENVT